MSVPWPSTRGPNTLSVALDDRDDDDDAEHDPHRAEHAGAGGGATFLKSFDRSPGTPAEFQRPGGARLGRREVDLLARPRLVVDERHAARSSRRSATARSRRTSGSRRCSSSCVPRPIDEAVLEHEDVVGGRDRRHPLRHDHDRGVLRVRAERGAQPGVGREVERRERVVEHVDVGLADQRPGDRQPLALPARHVGAALLDPRVQPAGHGRARSRRPARPRAPPTSLPRSRRACRTAGCSRPCPRRGTAAAGRGRSCSTARRGRGRARRRRRRSTVPSVLSNRRRMRLTSVVLPAPVLPTIAVVWPGAVANEMSLSTGCSAPG